MPKMKTNRAAAKRFTFTGTGKVKFNRAKRRHILTKKTRKLKRELRAGGIVAKCDEAAVHKLCPYK